jgi:hypothetical protein
MNTLIIIMNSVPDSAVLPVNDHIGFALSGDAFSISNSRTLLSVLGCDALVPLPAHGPISLIRYYMLMPGPLSRSTTSAFKDGLDQFEYQLFPGFFPCHVSNIRDWKILPSGIVQRGGTHNENLRVLTHPVCFSFDRKPEQARLSTKEKRESKN